MQVQSPVTISYPESLPVSERRQEIAEALHRHQIIVIAGETGSGKTTQIPKICLEAGYGRDGLIGHTQPRRLAARSVAARIAEELEVPLGDLVGYQVRFSDHSSPATRIKLMTDGILLNEIQRDRKLRQYDVLIIDEAHERSLNIDFLLGYLRQLTVRRPDLKVIITSATIDVEKFAKHFRDAPIISVSGRSYPVDILYRDPAEHATEDRDEDVLTESVLRALREISQLDRHRGRTGDVLVFLSGEREIRDIAAALRRHPVPDTEVLPLYARLSHSEQKRIFQPHRGRRIVLSTNVAETSLTVPGIEYVIDSGMARISRYSVASKVQRLPIEPVSQASANQRAGRCGRVAPGVCFRLYSEEDFNSRPAFTDPEIQRTGLSAVILQMLLLKLGDIERFPFIEPPARRAINDGFRSLSELGAIDEHRRLTDVGGRMARLPVDPRLARMLVDGTEQGCLYELLIIISALSIQDPREVPGDSRDAARQSHRRFDHPDSDFMSFLTLWDDWEARRQALSQNRLRRYAREHYLNFLRMREWRETHRQLVLACRQTGLKTPREGAGDTPDYATIHRCIIRGSLNQIGMKTNERSYLGSRNRQFDLFPSSTLYKRKPRWVVTAELLETSRLFATLAGRIEPEWVEQTAPDWLLKREYREPHWEKKRGQVVAFEKVSLSGLVLIEQRRRHFGPIDPEESRRIFIREALVEGQFQTRRRFLADNLRLIDSIRREEEKLRRPDILVSEEEMFAFYDQRVPAAIYGARQFESWCRKAEVDGKRLLHMRREDLRREAPGEEVRRHFPDRATIGDNPLAIRYRFAPGKSEDGASIDVPLPLLDQLQEVDLDWAVPGLVRERCIALLKGLPRSLRKQFIPVPAFVEDLLRDAEPGGRPLRELIRQEALRRKGVEISPEALRDVEIPPHLQPRVRLLDEQGRVLSSDSDLDALRRRYAERAGKAATPSVRDHPLVQHGLRDWQGEALPSQVKIRNGVTLQRYPGLRDHGESVSIELFGTPEKAERSHVRGLLRLLLFRTPQQRKSIEKSMRALPGRHGLRFPPAWKPLFPHEAVLAIYRQHFDPDHQDIRSPETFHSWVEQGRADLMESADRFDALFGELIRQQFDLHRSLAALEGAELRYARDDMTAQLVWLLEEGFPAEIPGGWLREYPRYLKALQLRLENFRRAIPVDRENQKVIEGLWEQYQRLPEAGRAVLADFPWLLQELRVSLFAQKLGTRRTVSGKRLERLLHRTIEMDRS